MCPPSALRGAALLIATYRSKLDPASAFCVDQLCELVVDGKLVCSDIKHYTTFAAAKLAEHLVRDLCD
ncbi:hypothetical protein [Nereida sp. MMG025]|uniref:hypothetical protein n=1 Tax=Nereida sp. MMG025 TaxID=2909981 RepID=UPI001F416BB1|nr:hypothetical protein [Nereida sp. MMG025]MCF6445894.1 hypothetical protein [Nereida sp. MMG025]